MGSQSVVFVDAGFLLAVGGQQAAGTSLRSAFDVDYEALIQGILVRAKEFCGLEALRVYWYDASKDAVFTDRHKRIGLISGVKVRLGRIAFSGEQKGVDLKLGLDMVGIARNRAASVAFLVSGDDDLAEAVEDAQDLGVKVVLIGLEKPDHRLGVASVAEHLALQVDSIITLPPDLIESCFTKQVASEPIPAPAAPVPAVSLPEAPVTVARPHPVPTPGKPRPPILTPVSRFQRSESQVVFTSSATGSSGSEDNPMDVAYAVGASLATNWYGSVTQNDVNELLADRPILPPEIDRVLLKDCAQRIGEWKTDIQDVRRTLRLAFWEKLDELI